MADNFPAKQLHPHLFGAACVSVGQNITLRQHASYDHGYYFTASFTAYHLHHHAQQLVLGCSA